MTPFTAVVVLHDSAHELAALLRSLERHLGEPPQLVVVDTGSSDGGPALARRHGAEVVELPHNPGFGTANNAGLARARHDVTVLLNPDVELVDDSVNELARAGSNPSPCAARPEPAGARRPRPALGPSRCPARSARSCPRSCTRRCCRARCASAPSRTAPSARAPSAGRSPRAWPRPRRCCAGSARSTPPSTCSRRTWSSCLRARAAGVPTVLHPQLRLRHAGGHAVLRSGEPFGLLARAAAMQSSARSAPRARTRDDAAQALTFATRIAARFALGRDHRARARPTRGPHGRAGR